VGAGSVRSTSTWLSSQRYERIELIEGAERSGDADRVRSNLRNAKEITLLADFRPRSQMEHIAEGASSPECRRNNFGNPSSVPEPSHSRHSDLSTTSRKRRGLSLGRRVRSDAVLGFILAAMLARAVNGTAAFFPTLGGSFVLVVLHRLLAYWSRRSHAFGLSIKGRSDISVRDGASTKLPHDAIA
jgi:hypothetical protein